MVKQLENAIREQKELIKNFERNPPRSNVYGRELKEELNRLEGELEAIKKVSLKQ
jgi:transposase